MEFRGDIPAVFEGGVFHPERDPGLPERTRVVLRLRESGPSEAERTGAFQVFERVRAEGGLGLNGSRIDRDALHERH